MKRTPFFNIHTHLNAKMGNFGGFDMPIQYNGINNEHMAIRNRLGVFDVSHMGEFLIFGPNAKNLLQYICSNNIEDLSPGKAQYNYFPNDIGGIVDDLIVYQLEDQKYLLVVNASNIEKDWLWIKKQNKGFVAKISDISEQTALLAIQGPKAIEAMQSICDENLRSLDNYSHITVNFANCKNILVAKTGYTGSGGIEIYFDPKYAKKIWDGVMDAGSSYGISPAGLAARDTLRLEMGYCLYGNEIDENRCPISAGLKWITKPETFFINYSSYEMKLKSEIKEKLVGFVMDTQGIPRKGYNIFDNKENLAGKVTSGTHSPSLKKGIGMGYVSSNFSKIGNKLFIQIREKLLPCTIIKLPFF